MGDDIYPVFPGFPQDFFHPLFEEFRVGFKAAPGVRGPKIQVRAAAPEERGDSSPGSGAFAVPDSQAVDQNHRVTEGREGGIRRCRGGAAGKNQGKSQKEEGETGFQNDGTGKS
jgi:hypothetical protein